MRFRTVVPRASVIELPQDFRDLLVALADEGAEFAVVGGYAVAFHGYVRATKDLDIFVRPTNENARRVYMALASFGAPLHAFSVAETDFAAYDGILQVGVAPIRIDILNRIRAVSFDEAVSSGDSFELEGRSIPVIGLDALIHNKSAVGREQDIADVALLRAARR
jgi:predicted nucleotidyltransferase